MNKQTLVTSCPIRMSVRKGSQQFASLQHSGKKTKLCYCYIGELKPRSTLTCVGRVSWARACKASENGALPALDYGSAALASSTLPKQVSLAG